MSIFHKYYQDSDFIDQYLLSRDDSIDVIIPVIHTNELWQENLKSVYREIPVNRLLIGDGGCIDNSIFIVQEFPRVQVLDHQRYKSLGYSLKRLIEAVETEWFVYLHSDVYLPNGWFDDIKKYKKNYDWIECNPILTVLVELPLDHEDVQRSFSGAQMGRIAAFQNILPLIEDDYLYRNEDIVLAELINSTGGGYVRVKDIYHYHQEMGKPSRWQRKVRRIRFDWEMSSEEANREHLMQVKGIIKYLNPRDDVPLDHYSYLNSVRYLYDNKIVEKSDLEKWIKSNNKDWLKIHRRKVQEYRLLNLKKSLHEFLYSLFEYCDSLLP